MGESGRGRRTTSGPSGADVLSDERPVRAAHVSDDYLGLLELNLSGWVGGWWACDTARVGGRTLACVVETSPSSGRLIPLVTKCLPVDRPILIGWRCVAASRGWRDAPRRWPPTTHHAGLDDEDLSLVGALDCAEMNIVHCLYRGCGRNGEA